MKKKITSKEWNVIEDALMKAEIPYSVNFDSHKCMDGNSYEKIIEISPFAIVYFDEVADEN